MMINKITKAHR